MIYDAHQPIGPKFEPPRAGTMPERDSRFVSIGLDQYTENAARRRSESNGYRIAKSDPELAAKAKQIAEKKQ